MPIRIAIDRKYGAEVLVRTGHGRVASIEGIGRGIKGGWPFYLVDLDLTGTPSHEEHGALPRRPVLLAKDPLHLFALEAVTSGEIVDWCMVSRRLPHISPEVPFSYLDEIEDSSCYLTGLAGVACTSRRLQLL